MLVYADVTDLAQHTDQLKVLATVDGMTGLFKRRHFLSLVLFDIDGFKSITPVIT
jgi:GGDEF domain-containing protein